MARAVQNSFRLRAFIFYAVGWGIFLEASVLRADEEIIEVPGFIQVGPVETEDEPSEGSPSPPAPPFPVGTPAAPSPVDRMWMTSTPLAPTAYGLDGGKFQAAVEQPAISIPLVMKVATVGIKMGVSDRITLGLGWNGALWGSSSMIAIGEAKWNFLNSGAWAWAVQPWAGFRLRDSAKESQAPLGATLSTSCGIDPYQKLHLSASWGKNEKRETYRDDYSYYRSDGSYGYSSYASNTLARREVIRLSMGYELRFSRRHGMTFSVSPQYATEKESYVSTSDGSAGSTSHVDRYRIGVLPGVAYHYQRSQFGVGIGLEGGPTYEHYRYDSQYGGQYSNDYAQNSFSVFGMANIAGSVDLRF